jgi:tetratricopeptide (TPR) repeat protein
VRRSATRTVALVTGVLVLGASPGCTPDEQRTDTLDVERALQRRDAFPPAGLEELDAGNEAFGQEDYETALAHYRTATEIMPDNAASWFGISMAAQALGMTELADSAMVEAQALAPGASLLHPVDSGGGTP